MTEIQNENDPVKKKALMRDLLRGVEVSKPVENDVPNLEKTLKEVNMSKRNFYVKFPLKIVNNSSDQDLKLHNKIYRNNKKTKVKKIYI